MNESRFSPIQKTPSGPEQPVTAVVDAESRSTLPVESGFLPLSKIAEAIKNHFDNQAIVLTSDFTNYAGVTFIARCEFPDQSESDHYVYLNLEPDSITYRLSPGDAELIRSPYKPGTDYGMLKAQSETTKVVKSRPTFLYPELLGVDYEDLWPRGAKVAVIGDPYMSCDKTGVTIVEYEYGEEMMPPVLGNVINGDEDIDRLYQRTMTWVENLHREDIQALGRIGHPLERPGFSFDVQPGNPYWHTVDACFRMVGTVSELIGSVETNVLTIEELDQSIDMIDEQLAEIKQTIARLVDGSWSRSDFARYIDEIADPQGQKFAEGNLGFYFNIKQRIMEQLGDASSWTKYIERWENYLDRLPVADMQPTMPDIDKRIKQVRHWLKELPTVTSSQRVTKAFSELEDTYQAILEWAFRQPKNDHGTESEEYEPYDYLLHESGIAEARGTGMMDDSAFGIDVPGYPVTLRTKNFLELAYKRAENATIYARNIWPKLHAEKNRLDQTGIQQNPETQLAYLRSFEHALVRSFITISTPQQATALHGFFPEDVQIDPQDRIVALTSVTMHGWNHLDQAGFSQNITSALPYLNVGGRYILGPINQEIYFGQPTSAFDSDGLTRALEAMKTEGLIDYHFVKGRRSTDDSFGQVNDNDEETFSADDQVLLPDESAASLVIERLK